MAKSEVVFEEDVPARRRIEEINGKRYEVWYAVDTGFIISRNALKDAVTEEKPKKKGLPPGKRPTYVKLYRLTWQDIVMNARLTTHEIAVFCICMAFLEWETGYLVRPDTKAKLTIAEVAELTHQNRASFYRTLKALAEKGFLRLEKGRMGNDVRLNPHVAGFGNAVGVDAFKEAAYKPVVLVEESAK